MNPLLAEFIGTAILIILGNGVVANVVLNKTKGNNSGWIVITIGWAMAVFVAVYCVSKYWGAHLNPAVTLALSITGKFASASVLPYILSQMAGAIFGASIVYLLYKDHFDATEDKDGKLACFCNAPAINNTINNLFNEIILTFIFVFAVLSITGGASSLGSLDALPVAFTVLAIGISLGGTTGYAINPARDLGPRIAHFILPIKNKRDANWAYAWIPVVGPLLGGALAALFYQAVVIG